ncbi:MAG: tetratricopeptide repeat protein [Candidatus Pacebacteria bacterium]|jgi:tetratricopeptide (TPR) repeat protein|nr:hypothetical protein [bacterium]MDP6527995.1 tetratricopeptide repeat protein [Candidatus Paceibacterota bacterium]MDP6659747.1 tetratricopeptide repeat protein [Candidatus Paceibacterota bacterium]|tara:strand:+ start:10077 stop:10799 length:723 start_codon:yes stop_codon:yes gene_type:complete
MDKRGIKIVLLILIVSAIISFSPKVMKVDYFERGNLYFGYGNKYNLDIAREYFKRALEEGEDHLYAKHQLARIYFLEGDFDEAIRLIDEQVERHGDNVISSFYVHGLINGYAGNFDKAEESFLHYLSVKDRNWAAYNDLAWVYFSKGDFNKSEEYARLGLAIAPQNPWLLTTLGSALMNLNLKERAKRFFEEALSEAKSLTEEEWSRANPGNDSGIAGRAIENMILIIKDNLALVRSETF